MSLNFFSIVLIGILVLQTQRNKQKEYFCFIFQLTLFVYLTLNVGYFIRIKGISIDYYRFLLYYLGAMATAYNIKSGINKKAFFHFLVFGMAIAVGLILGLTKKYKIVSLVNGGWGAYLFNTNNEVRISFGSTQIKLILDFISTSMVLIYIRRNFIFETWMNSMVKVAKWLKVTMVYGLLEAIYIYIFHAYTLNFKITSTIFGVAESTYMTALSRGNGYQLQGLFKEPAQYARGLFLSVILLYMVNKYKKNRSSFFWLMLCIALMLMSMSFTSLLLCAVLILLFIIYKCKENPKILPFILFAGGIIVVGIIATASFLIKSGSYYGIRLKYALTIVTTMVTLPDLTKMYESMRSFVHDGSSILRIGSSYANLRINLPKNWLFGIGLGNSCSFSYTSNLITDLGIIGTLLYMKFFVFWEYKNWHYIIAVLIYYMANLLTSTTQMFGVDVIMIFFVFGCLFGKSSKERTGMRRRIIL